MFLILYRAIIRKGGSLGISDSIPWALAAASVLGLIILLPLAARVFAGREGGLRRLVILEACLCVALALCLVPLMVGAVLGFQRGPSAAYLLDSEDRIIIVLWLLMLAGSALALPAMARDIRFDG